MPLACKICIAKYGLRGSEIESLFQTEDDLIEHIEKVHHMPVRRKDETEVQAIKRFIKKYPEAKTCPECIAAQAPWTKEVEGGNST